MNQHFLVFSLEGRRCALPLKRVERVLRAVEITPLPGAKLSPLVRGVINVHGKVVPVFDVRKTRAKQEVHENEQMILVSLSDERRALILCDEVEGVREVETHEVASSGALLPATLEGRGDVLTLAGELVYVNDLDALLEDAPESVAWPQEAWPHLETAPEDSTAREGEIAPDPA
jgi:purine-binding chemotaxis protein CheW